jgi:hypothetical protein
VVPYPIQNKYHERDHHFFGHKILPKCGKKWGKKKEEYGVKIFLIFLKKHGQISRIFFDAFRL